MHDRVAIALTPKTAALLERQVPGSSTPSNHEERPQRATRRRKQSGAQSPAEQYPALTPAPAPGQRRAATRKSASPNASSEKPTNRSSNAKAAVPVHEHDRVHDPVIQLARLLARQTVAEFTREDTPGGAARLPASRTNSLAGKT